MNDPAGYTKTNGLSNRDTSVLCEEFVDAIGLMSGRCLDIGSGPGDAAVEFILPKLNTESSLICSDISEKMLNFAKEKYKNNHRLSFLKLDIETPNLPKDLIEQFDHVTSFFCLHWCQDMRQVFDNIFNLLRPGGTALLNFIADLPVFDAYEKLAAMPRYQPYMEDVDRFIPVFQHAKGRCETLEALLRVVGFRICHCSVRRGTYSYDNPDDLSKSLMAVNPFVERIPAYLRKEYSRDVVKEVARQSNVFRKNNNNENEHSIVLTYHTFVVYLSKPEAK